MDGWSPTYQAGRVKVIGRLINLTPSDSVNLPLIESAVNCVGRPCQLEGQRIAFLEVSIGFVTAYEGTVWSSFDLDLTVNDYRGHHPYAIVPCESKLSDK